MGFFIFFYWFYEIFWKIVKIRKNPKNREKSEKSWKIAKICIQYRFSGQEGVDFSQQARYLLRIFNFSTFNQSLIKRHFGLFWPFLDFSDFSQKPQNPEILTPKPQNIPDPKNPHPRPSTLQNPKTSKKPKTQQVSSFKQRFNKFNLKSWVFWSS